VTVTVYRLTQTKHLQNAFDGEGARLNGGRWNCVGTPMVYTSSSLSLATLELLVHIEDISIINGLYSVIPVEFDDPLIERISETALPIGWDAPEPIADTQILGDEWINGASSAVLEIPSAVTTSESNFLFNPQHSDFGAVRIGASYRFRPDPRLKHQ